MSELYRLAYFSRCMLPADNPEKFSAGIRSILGWSRPWNRNHGITGALLFTAGYFAQVLEGPGEAVQATLGHICCDKRNKDPKLLQFGPVEDREFSGWAMAFVDGTDSAVVLSNLASPVESTTGMALIEMLKFCLQGSE